MTPTARTLRKPNHAGPHNGRWKGGLDRYVANAEGCWIWTGPLDKGGYGHLRYHGRQRKAYRAMYEREVGPVPPGLTLDHLCRVRSCVNPAHLEVVTNRENLLRGVGFAAVNARKTACPKGHPLDGRTRVGWRYCCRCRADWKRAHR